MDEPISQPPEKEEDKLLTFMGILRLDKLECLEKVYICMCFIVCVMLSIYIHICWRTRWRKREIQT